MVIQCDEPPKGRLKLGPQRLCWMWVYPPRRPSMPERFTGVKLHLGEICDALLSTSNAVKLSPKPLVWKASPS
jgi:hypothetical protein